MSSQDASQIHSRAETLKEQGRFAEAETEYRRALDADPQSPQLWWSLGDLYAQMENFAGVEHCCRRVLAANPNIPEVHLYLGMALQRQGRLEDAAAALQAAARLNPALGEARYQLGIVQQSLGRDDAAIENYRAALTAVPDPAPVRYNLSVLYAAQGRVAEAFAHARDALRARPASLKYAQHFVKLFNAACPAAADADLRNQMLRCFETPGLDTAPLLKPGVVLLGGDPAVRRAVAVALHESPQGLEAAAARGAFEPLFGNALLYSLLLHTKIASPEVEALLCALRRLALDAVAGPSAIAPEHIVGAGTRFAEALACQCFNTDYAALVTAAEAAAVAELADRLSGAIARGAVVDAGLVRRVAVLCMYRPLASLEGIAQLVERDGGALAAALPLVVRRQWVDWRTEQALRERIETLTPIAGGVSSEVRAQYEESPYPRWFSVDLREPASCRELLRVRFPQFEPPTYCDGPLDILIAGCGTGHHTLLLAAELDKSAVLAVDLSRASLAYAMRKAAELGVNNIRFAQADILELGSLERRFHLIESMGVLHHMQNPRAGLQILSGLLHDGGLLRLGLYSAAGRRSVAAARQYIAGQGFETTPDGIRAARRALLALDEDHPAYPVTRFRDFYTLSECRDLLFHVQEHRLTIPDLSRWLDACGLRFIGFTLADAGVLARYRQTYPDDPDMTDLSHWHEFEQTYPDTFEEMYQFWCQKV